MKTAKQSLHSNAASNIQSFRAQKPRLVKASPPYDLQAQDQDRTIPAPSADEVASRAYLNYQNHGAADGRDVQDWLLAEAELISERQLSAKR